MSVEDYMKMGVDLADKEYTATAISYVNINLADIFELLKHIEKLEDTICSDSYRDLL